MRSGSIRRVRMLVLLALLVPAASAVAQSEDPYSAGMRAFSEANYQTAVRHFNEALQKYPDNTAYLYMLAMSYARSGKPMQAVAAFEKVILGEPDEELLAKAYINMLRTLVDLQDRAEVERIGTEANEALPANGEILNQIGRARLNDADYQGAIEVLTRATRLDTGSWNIYNNLGLAYLRSGNFKGAVLAFERAADLNKGQPFVYNNLGVAYEQLHRYDESIRAFQKALELDAGYSKARQNIKRIQKLKARASKSPNYAIESGN